MSGSTTHEITELLKAWSSGDERALEKLTPLVYAELHRIAARYMTRERGDHTLQTTALVNEAFRRLIEWETASWNDRTHFFGVSAQIMRRILVDFARRQARIGSIEIRPLTEAGEIAELRDPDVVALHEALNELEKFDARKARIVELKFFGGLTHEEIAGLLKVAPITVLRDWQKAKAWLYRELSHDS